MISTAIGAAAVGVPLAILGASVWEEDEPINQVVCAWGYPGCKGKNRWQSPAEQAFALGVMGAAVGGGIGLVAGAMGVFDSWYPVRVPARLAVVPGREGAGFTASIRF